MILKGVVVLIFVVGLLASFFIGYFGWAEDNDTFKYAALGCCALAFSPFWFVTMGFSRG